MIKHLLRIIRMRALHINISKRNIIKQDNFDVTSQVFNLCKLKRFIALYAARNLIWEIKIASSVGSEKFARDEQVAVCT